jgi:hypothetical protein
MKSFMHKFIFLFITILLSACSNSVTNPFNGSSFFSTSNENNIETVSNSTLVSTNQCSLSNQIKIKISIPANQDYQCIDQSALPAGERRGLICEGGVSVMDFPVNSSRRSCDNLTLCGLPPTSRTELNSRFDGKIEELTFANLPWGCSGKIVYGPKLEFDKKAKTFISKVSVPSCPFCNTLNKYTCLPCSALGTGETIVAGQVITTSCGGSCVSCNVNGTIIAHGSGRDFFKNPSAQCRQTCDADKQFRVCNNGNFMGSPNYQNAQCVETPCGCQIPGTAITFDSGKITKLFSREVIACGTICKNIDVRCNNGSWRYTNNSEVVPVSILNLHNLQTCSSTNTCKCNLPSSVGGGFINSSSSRRLYRIDSTTCDAPSACSMEANYTTVNCSLTGVLSAFDQSTYRHPSCRTPTCQCTYAGVRIDLGRTVFLYKKEVANEGETCDSLSASFTCNQEAKLVGSQSLATYPAVYCQSDNDSGNLGGTGGGVGNDEGPGSALKSRFGLGDGGGGGGGPCVDGTVCTTNITQTSFLNPKKLNCDLPWGNSEVEFYGSIIAFSQTCVVTPAKCTSVRQSRTCVENGELTGSSSFRYNTCEEKASCP